MDSPARFEVATSTFPDWYYLVAASEEDTAALKTMPGTRIKNDALQIHASLVDTDPDFKVVYANFEAWKPKVQVVVDPRAKDVYETLLRPYQKVGVDFILDRAGTLLGDEPGVGKSLQSLTAIALTGVTPVIVMGTLLSKSVWCGPNSDAKKYLGIDIVPLSSRKNAGADAFKDPSVKWFFCHYDILKAWVPWIFTFLRPRAAIFDEAHKMSPRSQRGRSSAAISRFREMYRRVVITATPVQNKRQDIWLPLDLAAPDSVGNLHQFGQRYSGAIKGEYGWLYEGETHNEELKARMAHLMIRRTKADVMAYLPAIVRESVEVEMSDSENDEYAKYKSAERDIRAFLDKYEGKSLAAGITGERLVQLTKLLSLVSKAKCSATTELAIDLAKATKKVVVFCWFKDSAKLISRGLQRAEVEVYGPITGEMDVEDRIAQAQAFADSTEPAAFVATLAAASESINELVACQEGIIQDLTWNTRLLLQAEGRLHRSGQQGSVHFTYVTAKDTIDSLLMEVLYKKSNDIESLGIVDDAKKLVQGLGGAAPEDDLDSFVKALSKQVEQDGFGLYDEDSGED